MHGATTNFACNVIREVTFEHSHLLLLIIGDCMSSKLTRIASVDYIEVFYCERSTSVPLVDLRLSFEAEKDCVSIVCAYNHELVGFSAGV